MIMIGEDIAEDDYDCVVETESPPGTPTNHVGNGSVALGSAAITPRSPINRVGNRRVASGSPARPFGSPTNHVANGRAAAGDIALAELDNPSEKFNPRAIKVFLEATGNELTSKEEFAKLNELDQRYHVTRLDNGEAKKHTGLTPEESMNR